jgi:hypothetical protein
MGTSANNRLEAAMTYFKVAYRYLPKRYRKLKKNTHTHTDRIASLCINIST